jgi:hypothetical protein
MIQTPKIPEKTGGFGTNRCPYVDPWYFCGDVLRKIFDVPEWATHIQFKAYRNPGVDRCAVSLDTNGFDSDFDGLTAYLMRATVRSMRRLDDRRDGWFVECYYWE